MAAIKTLLVKRVRDLLVEVHQTNMLESDPEYADIVQIGRYLGDPVKDNIILAVNSGDPQDPLYLDGVADAKSMDDLGMRFPTREVGGGTKWWRRGIITVSCYFVKERFSVEEALEYANNIQARTIQALDLQNVSDLLGDFGEKGQILFVKGASFHAGGGNNSQIWRGRVLWQALTTRF